MEHGEVTSVLEYIDFLHAILGRLSIEEIDYSDYCQMTDYLDEIEKRVKQLEKKQEPMKPKRYIGEYEHENYPICPACGSCISDDNFCFKCGQKLNWEVK